MSLAIQVFPTTPTRPCRFCLSLQDGSVFADFDVDDDGHVFLRRISFDGYGCCHGEFTKMSADDSRGLLASIERDPAEDPECERLLRSYFQENAGAIWEDALKTHELL